MSDFLHRLRFYLIGFSIGIVMVLFIFGPRSMQCSYFPNSRTLEEAKYYPMSYSDEVKSFMEKEGLDSVFIYDEIFKNSKVINFGSDEVRETPCRTYRAEYRRDKSYDFVFKICKKETELIEIKPGTTVSAE